LLSSASPDAGYGDLHVACAACTQLQSGRLGFAILLLGNICFAAVLIGTVLLVKA
jgi:hypothetical protein